MRVLSALMLLAPAATVVAVSSCALNAAPGVSLLKVNLEVEQRRHQSPADIDALLHIENVGESNVRVPRDLRLGSYYLGPAVIGPDGKEVKYRCLSGPTEYKGTLEETVLIEPGAFYGRRMQFHFTEPGEYQLGVVFYAPSADDIPDMAKGTHESNLVPVEVLR